MWSIFDDTISVAGTGGTTISGMWTVHVFAGQPPMNTDVNGDLCFLLCLRTVSE